MTLYFDALFVLQRHPDGVASVAFKEPEEADACIQSFNGRWFGGRQLSAQFWDGKTDYQVKLEPKLAVQGYIWIKWDYIY